MSRLRSRLHDGPKLVDERPVRLVRPPSPRQTRLGAPLRARRRGGRRRRSRGVVGRSSRNVVIASSLRCRRLDGAAEVSQQAARPLGRRECRWPRCPWLHSRRGSPWMNRPPVAAMRRELQRPHARLGHVQAHGDVVEDCDVGPRKSTPVMAKRHEAEERRFAGEIAIEPKTEMLVVTEVRPADARADRFHSSAGHSTTYRNGGVSSGYFSTKLWRCSRRRLGHAPTRCARSRPQRRPASGVVKPHARRTATRATSRLGSPPASGTRALRPRRARSELDRSRVFVGTAARSSGGSSPPQPLPRRRRNHTVGPDRILGERNRGVASDAARRRAHEAGEDARHAHGARATDSGRQKQQRDLEGARRCRRPGARRSARGR